MGGSSRSAVTAPVDSTKDFNETPGIWIRVFRHTPNGLRPTAGQQLAVGDLVILPD